MKICIECKQLLPLDLFYAHQYAKDRHSGVCKECHKGRMKRRSLTNPAVQEYDRARSKRPEKRLKIRAVAQKWREQHPEAYRAQTAVGNALRDGKLKRCPCTLCGTNEHVHGHHKDYSKPLEVTWLCAKCHQRLHAAFPELGGHRDSHQKLSKLEPLPALPVAPSGAPEALT